MKLDKLITSLLSAIAVIGLSTSVATANPRAEGAGFTIGVGADVGHLECEGDLCDGMTEAGGLNLHAGMVLLPQLALTADLWGMAHREDRLTVSQSMVTVGPQVWLIPRLWLRAGIGLARASYNYDAEIVDFMDETEWVPAGMAAAGIELIQGDNVVMDLQLRAGSGFFHEGETQIRNMSIGLGASWY